MKKLYYLFFFVLCFQACAPIYVPSPAVHFNNVEQGDAFFGTTLGFFNLGVQGGYAITDHVNIGLVLNSKSASGYTIGNSISEEGIAGVEIQGIAGYYNRVGATSVFELNGGYGFSSIRRPGEIGNQTNVFIQPGFTAYKPNSKWAMFASMKSNYLMYDETVQMDSIAARTGLFFEPNLQVTYGDKVKATFQVGYSLEALNQLDSDYQPLIMNLGIRYNIRRSKD
jgi:hypothetical protein